MGGLLFCIRRLSLFFRDSVVYKKWRGAPFFCPTKKKKQEEEEENKQIDPQQAVESKKT